MFLPSSSEPIMRYRLKAYSSLSLPRPKSSRVHWSTPTLLMIRQGSTTVEPMTAVCGDGSLANLCSNRGSAASHSSSRLHQASRQHQPGCHPPPRICNADSHVRRNASEIMSGGVPALMLTTQEFNGIGTLI